MTIERYESATELTLEELAVELRAACAEFEQAALVTVRVAIRIGTLLLAARDQVVGLGESWEDWLQDNVPFSMTTAKGWIRLAYYQDEVGDASTVFEAVRALKGLPATRPPGNPGFRWKYPEALRDEAKRLVAGGTAIAQVARQFDLPHKTVEHWVYPERQVAYYRRRRAAELALVEKEKQEARQRGHFNE